MATYGEHFDIPVTIPENGKSFKEWEAGEKFEPVESDPIPTPDIQAGIPEDSDAFREWERNRTSE